MNTNLELNDLAPPPQEEWRRMLRFVGWNEDSRLAALPSIETLLQHAHEMVVSVYDYLSHVPETAAILGWERGVDRAHLEERRRFFTIWISRTLGLDTSDEFALYLFKAGKYHAADGPRKIHTPEPWITTSVGMVQSMFATHLAGAGLSAPALGAAMSAWSRYLSVQLNQMHLGYKVAMEMKRGEAAIPCAIFGKLRPVVETSHTTIHIDDGAPAHDLLRKFFNYYPQARADALEQVWHSHQPQHSSWMEVMPSYVPKYGWRILLNGRDLEYAGGFAVPVHINDEVSIFPPGR
jgi:molybdopterin converting factor small subunit